MSKPKILLMAIIFISTSSLTNAQYLKELKMKDSHSVYNDTIPTIQYASEKSPLLAGALSFIVPGLSLGQIYNNVPSKIFRHLGISAGSFTLLMIAGEYGWFRLDLGCGVNNHDTWIPYSLVFIYLGNWIWSVVDAAVTANDINKRAMLKKSRSDILNKLKFGFTLDKNKQLNLKFAFEL